MPDNARGRSRKMLSLVSNKSARIGVFHLLDNPSLVVSEGDMVIIDGARQLSWNEQTSRYDLALPSRLFRDVHTRGRYSRCDKHRSACSALHASALVQRVCHKRAARLFNQIARDVSLQLLSGPQLILLAGM